MAMGDERSGGIPARTNAENQGDAARTMKQKKGRGFASMDPERQREIASKGGRAAHRKGTAHQWSAAEAREAGRKGGTIVSRDREHMAAIGRQGGAASQRKSNKGARGGSSSSRGDGYSE